MAVDSGSGSTYQASQVAAKNDGRPRFNVKIFSPYQTYYQGEAVSLSAVNQTGPFDVLPGHMNFFSLVSGGQVVVETGFQRLDFQIARGILRVSNDVVTLFADV